MNQSRSHDGMAKAKSKRERRLLHPQSGDAGSICSARDEPWNLPSVTSSR